MLGNAFILASLTITAAAAPLQPRNNSQGDPCAALIGVEGFYTSSVIKACLHSIPFQEDVRQNIMASVTALNTLNIFQYNQLGNENEVLNQGVDLDAEFERINTTDYGSDYEFQKDLSDTLKRVNDGHYAWTSCYASAFGAVHYLPIVSLMNGDDTSVFLAPNLPLYAARNGLLENYAGAGYNLTELAGAEVTTIEGQSPWNYLDNVAGPDGGVYQDPEQRLNFQFASYSIFDGGFGLLPGEFTQTSSFDKDNITLTVKSADGKEMDVTSPWLGRYQGTEAWNFSSGEEFFNAACLVSGSSAGGSSGGMESTNSSTNSTEPMTGSQQDSNTTATDSQDITQMIDQIYAGCPINTRNPRYQYENSPQNSSAYLGGRDIQFYSLGDEAKTGVIYLSTFDPKPPSASPGDTAICTKRFVIDTYEGFRNLTKAGVQRIMIDTTNNAGGTVTLNQFLQRYLTGDAYQVDLNFDTLLRKSPLSEALLKATIQAGESDATANNIYQPGKYRNGTAMVAPDEDIFQPGNEYTINAKTLYTSNVVQDDLEFVDDLDGTLNISDSAPYPPNEIVFVGNGLCGSACASFTNFLIEYYNATAYITSGRPRNQIEFQAFAAGQAITSTAIYDQAFAVSFTNYELLPRLEVVGNFDFTIRGALSPNIAPGTFIQYRTYPAQGTYGLTAEQFLDPLENWKYVASKAFN